MRRSAFVCQQCGHQSAKWLGRCPGCDAWGSLVEESTSPALRPAERRVDPVPLDQIPSQDTARISTGIEELDRVLGGGLVHGAVVLVGGEPGIGKSTLLLQASGAMAGSGRRILYVSGEESALQLRLRAERLGVRGNAVEVLAETDVDAVSDAARRGGHAAVLVDSIQAVRCADLAGVPGSVGQVRESAARLLGLAKAVGVPVILVGHVTKDGSLAGPRSLEHLVDAVLHFEGDRHHAFRVLRAVKNRFGPADELGVFAMSDTGLSGVPNASEMFLAERPVGAAGSAVLAAVEGSRPVLVEVQALVGAAAQGTPRRTSLGIDSGRLALILAVLSRRAGIDLGARDVFVNVAGGLEVDEPAADLAVALAVASSWAGRALPGDQVAAGEIGLAGEIRAVSRLDGRLREAARLGFRSAIVPAGAPRPPEGLALLEARDIVQALAPVLAGLDTRPSTSPRPRLLDTSALIDGRIARVAEAGFLEGEVLVPAFVLTELRGIAADSDPDRAARGRRGLETIEALRALPSLRVSFAEDAFPAIRAVDAKLIETALRERAVLVTHDVALGRSAAERGVEVRDLHSLARAVRAATRPGETFAARVVREGRETDQGIAYLEDGTMVVIEGGRPLVGREVELVVTRVVPSASGQVFFARPSDQIG